MTVTVTTNTVTYTGNGVTTQFDFSFKIFSADHLVVSRQVISSGAIDKVYTSGEYTVAGVDDPAGGSITLLGTPLSASYKIIIQRIVPYTQTADIVNQGGFYPEVVEDQLDINVMQMQQLAETIGRAVVAPVGQTGIALPTKEYPAYWAYNGAGDFDFVPEGGEASILRAELLASAGSSIVGFLPSGTGAVARTVQDRLRDWVSAFDFMTAAQVASVKARDETQDVTAALQAAIDALWAAGGGTLYCPPGLYKTTAPLKNRDKVHIVGAGRGATHIKNALTPYNFQNSAVFQPGTFHPTYTQTFYGHASTHAINAAAAGANTVTLTTAGDAANYAVGDTVWIFTTSYYTSGGGQKIPEYAALAKVIGKASATLTLDRALSVAVTGSIHNITTTSVNGADSTPLRAVADIRIADMTIETIGYWIADSAVLRGHFENLHVIGRAAFYGNTYQLCRFENVTGRVGVKVGELSHNSELTTVDGFALAFDAAIATSSGCISFQENARGITYRNGSIEMAGYTGTAHGIWFINAKGCLAENIRLNGAPAFGASAVAFGSISIAAGRIPCTNNAVRQIDWSGDCERYVYFTGAGDETGNLVDASQFYGTISAGEAVRFTGMVLRNTVRDCYFDQSRLFLSSGVVKQDVFDCYFATAPALLSASDETLWRDNRLERITFADSYSRRLLNVSETGSPSLTTSEVNFVDSAIGTDTLKLGDVIDVCLRVNVTGTTSTKTLTVKFYNGTTDVDLFDWIIAAGSTGTGWFKGTISFISPTNIVCTGMAVIGGTATYFNNVITSSISGNPLTYRISGQLGNVADTCQVREITSRLTNPVIA